MNKKLEINKDLMSLIDEYSRMMARPPEDIRPMDNVARVIAMSICTQMISEEVFRAMADDQMDIEQAAIDLGYSMADEKGWVLESEIKYPEGTPEYKGAIQYIGEKNGQQ